MKYHLPGKSWPVFLLLISALLAFGSEQQPQPQQDKKTDRGTATTDPKAQSDGNKKELYGNMPEDLEPYRDFAKEPYHKYFVPSDAAITFWGPGRDKPDPDVDKVLIGMMAPVERSHETYIGRSMLNATRMALDEANAAGGYKGKPFDIIVRNDSGLWGASANEVVSFSYDDNVWAILGTVDGANSHIAIRVALRTDIPMVNVADLDPTLMETRIPWVFRVIPDDRQMAYTIAYYVYKQLGLQKVAILRANNRYGRFGVAQFRKSSIRLGKPAPIEVNYEINYENVNPDFTAQIERLQKAQPDAVILWADPQPAAWLVRKMREAGMKIPVVACERIISPSFLQIAGEAAEGVIATSPFNPDSDSPKLVAFKKHYQEKFGAPPDAYAAHSYDGAGMLIEAIRKAGLNRYRIRDALAEMTRWEGVTGEIVMDDVFTNRRPVCVATVKGGRFVYGTPHFEHLF
jgi:branched-chain amino acid transport system substrate-binding protein